MDSAESEVPKKKRAVRNVGIVTPVKPESSAKPSSSKSVIKPASRNQAQINKSTAEPPKGVEPDKDEAFLKAVATKKRGKVMNDALDREFNNLRISRPELEQDDQRKEWAVLEDFGDDGDLRGNFMVIVEIDVKEGGERTLRRSESRLDWEGRPDFKKFKKVRICQDIH